VGPDPQAVLLDELEQTLKVLEKDLEAERASSSDKDSDIKQLEDAYAVMLDNALRWEQKTKELEAANSDLKTELAATAVDRDALIALLENNPDILNEIEQIVEEDVVEEMSDREKLLDLLEKNPGVINDMAEIFAAQITKKQSGPGWLDR
jgi:dephospho-CoA kinase